MRAVAIIAFAAALCALTASAGSSEGNWFQPTITNTTAATYTSMAQWYGRRIMNTWSLVRNAQPTGYEPVVEYKYNPQVEGWQYLSIAYNASIFQNSTDGYYVAGYVEGYETFDDIYSTWYNQVKPMYDETELLPRAQEFLDKHIKFAQDHETTTEFGRQLARQMKQVAGIAAGFSQRYDEVMPMNMSRKLTYRDIYLVSYMEELDNINGKFSPDRQAHMMAKRRNRQHCSALVKRTNSDLFFSHDTWSAFNTMLRQYKKYDFDGQQVVMSSYAGSISSIDDFYMTSHRLAVQETTNGFYNESLYDEIKPDQVSEFNRVMIANFLAESPKNWFELFAYENSGTYNNQYMVADMAAALNAITSLQALPAGTFYVGEQIPGLVVYEDQTDFLNKNFYWPSFNIPYYPEIYARSGFNTMNTSAYWGLNGYKTYARGRIFTRMHDQVTNESTMYYMMRFNNWREDQDSTIPWCNTPWNPKGVVNCTVPQCASLAIAARYDLNQPAAKVQTPPGGEDLAHMVEQGMFGAIDVKMTSAQWMQNDFKALAVNGPTNVQNPVFDHDEYVRKYGNDGQTWRGVANRFDFRPVWFVDEQAPTMAPTGTPTPSGPIDHHDDDDKKDHTIGIAVGVSVGVCIAAVAGVFYFRHRASRRTEYDEGRALV